MNKVSVKVKEKLVQTLSHSRKIYHRVLSLCTIVTNTEPLRSTGCFGKTPVSCAFVHVRQRWKQGWHHIHNEYIHAAADSRQYWLAGQEMYTYELKQLEIEVHCSCN